MTRCARFATAREGVLSGAEVVNTLAGSIEESARAKRTEIERAMGILGDVRSSVQEAATEVVVLNRTAEDINKFVASVSRIAEQTDLLALERGDRGGARRPRGARVRRGRGRGAQAGRAGAGGGGRRGAPNERRDGTRGDDDTRDGGRRVARGRDRARVARH